MKRSLLFFGLGVLFCIPAVVAAQIVPCTDNCGFNDLVQMAQNILNFIVSISVVVAAGMFAFAGILYFTAGGDSGKVTKASKVFTSTAIGIVIILVAWLVVDTILTSLTGKGLEQRANNPTSYHIDIERRIG